MIVEPKRTVVYICMCFLIFRTLDKCLLLCSSEQTVKTKNLPSFSDEDNEATRGLFVVDRTEFKNFIKSMTNYP